MRRAVLDASVVLKWFAAEQRGSVEARQLQAEYQAGRLAVVVPSIFFLELLNVAGRRWRWEAEAVLELEDALVDLALEVGEPDLASVASWVTRGLTAYDAAYVAMAEEQRLALVTDDTRIVERAPGICRPLVGGPATAG